jgi:hypothetical protein
MNFHTSYSVGRNQMFSGQVIIEYLHTALSAAQWKATRGPQDLGLHSPTLPIHETCHYTVQGLKRLDRKLRFLDVCMHMITISISSDTPMNFIQECHYIYIYIYIYYQLIYAYVNMIRF